LPWWSSGLRRLATDEEATGSSPVQGVPNVQTMTLQERLLELVSQEAIAGFELQEQVGGEDGFRQTDELTLYFRGGQKLSLGTICSGIRENTSLMLL
jgi:hypothetical protein